MKTYKYAFTTLVLFIMLVVAVGVYAQYFGKKGDPASQTLSVVQLGGVNPSGNLQAVLTDASGNLPTVGTTAPGSTLSGNPTVVAGATSTGVVNTMPVACSGAKCQVVTMTNSAPSVGQAAVNAAYFAQDGTSISAQTFFQYLYNGTTFDPKFYCPNSAVINTAAAGTVQLVALSSGKSVRVCNISVESAGNTNVTFEYGTGASCGTGTTALTGPYSLTTAVAINVSGQPQLMATAAGNAFCVVNSAAIQISGFISYAQF